VDPRDRRRRGRGPRDLRRRAGRPLAGAAAVLARQHGDAQCGDEAAAREIYAAELAGRSQALPQFWLVNMAMLSELCAGLGDADGARALYAELAPFAARTVVVVYASCWGPVERYLALLAATAGDEHLRERHARAALARTEAMRAPLLSAELRARHADLLAA
jgi:hypothetical protein